MELAKWTRAARRRITAGTTSLALRYGPRLPASVIDGLEQTIARLGPCLPVLGRTVARNMRAAGVEDPQAVRDYFRQTALHLVNGLRTFRRGPAAKTLVEMARDQIRIDPSIRRLHAALASGRGAILVTPHVCNYVLTLARIAMETPVCVYLRWSKDPRKRELKRRWCEATGARVILEPAEACDPTSRAAACVEFVRGGATLVITPDIAQKRGRGVPVRLLGREAYLPAGPTSIAMLAEAPMVPVFGRTAEGQHVMTFGEPLEVRRPPRSEGGRAEGLRRAMQAWTDQFERFLLEYPQAWFLWADSRWTRFFRGDPKYCGPVAASSVGTPGGEG